jgi:hypothetical protein
MFKILAEWIVICSAIGMVLRLYIQMPVNEEKKARTARVWKIIGWAALAIYSAVELMARIAKVNPH